MATQRVPSTRATEKVATISTARKAVPPVPGDGVKKTAAQLQEERRVKIELAAYYLAERRGFEPGHEIEDWLIAEAETDRALLE